MQHIYVNMENEYVKEKANKGYAWCPIHLCMFTQ